MNGIMKGIVSLLSQILTDFGAVDALVGGMNHYQRLYNWMLAVQIDIVKPIAIELLTLLIMLELAQTQLRQAENCTSGWIGMGGLLRLAIRYALGYAVIDNTPALLTAIYSSSTAVAQGILNLTNAFSINYNFSGFIPVNLEGAGAEIVGSIILLIVAMLAAFVARMVVTVIVMSRFVELYLYYALAPLPLATITAEGHWNWGVGFVKSWFSVCFQSSGIVLVLGAFQYLAYDLTKDSSSVLMCCLGICSLCVALILLLMKVAPMTRQIFAA